MGPDSDEFPEPSFREREAISDYLKIEHEFMPPKVFYTLTCNAKYRSDAVSTIVRLTQGETIDTYVPYIAMNYFDRFVSTNPLSELRGSSIADKVNSVAMCCLTLSYKMRTTEFYQRGFLTRREATYSCLRIMRLEFRILSGLQWRMRSITAFHFLDYYYPIFKKIGGFRRRSINEILVQSQGEVYFTQFKPSELAMSALLAATYLGYHSQFNSIVHSVPSISREHMACHQEMVNLCRKRNIEILNSSGDVIFSSVVAISSLLEAARSKTQPIAIPVPKKPPSSLRSQFDMFLDSIQEEQDDTGPLAFLKRQNRNEEATSEEKDVESGSGATEDKREGASDETVESESRAREDKGKAVDEISEIEEESENELRQRKGKGVLERSEIDEETEDELRRQMKGKAVKEILAKEIEPKKAMNFRLRWPVTVRPGEVLNFVELSLQTDETRVTSTRCPTTIRGTGNDPPLVTNRCQCTIL